LTEAMDEGRNQFGVEGLRALCFPGGPLRASTRPSTPTSPSLRSGSASAQGVCEAVRDAVRAHTGSPAPQDDVTLVAVRVGQ